MYHYLFHFSLIGTTCSEEQVCSNSHCIHVEEYRANYHLRSCPNNCSNKGVCNERGNCHCDTGWQPPYCDRKGNGGSIDSGIPGIEDQDEFQAHTAGKPGYTVMTILVVLLSVVILVFLRQSFGRMTDHVRKIKWNTLFSHDLNQLLRKTSRTRNHSKTLSANVYCSQVVGKEIEVMPEAATDTSKLP